STSSRLASCVVTLTTARLLGDSGGRFPVVGVYVHVPTAVVVASPPVPALKPTNAVSPPTSEGMLIVCAGAVKDTPVIRSLIVAFRVVPSYVIVTWNGSTPLAWAAALKSIPVIGT